MYPLIRFAVAALAARKAPPLPLDGVHVSWHRCLPWDLDPWMELNNGRTLTLFDLGRVGLSVRTGLATMLRREGWGMAVAGASVRYRRRVRVFQKLRMTSHCVGHDPRFVYMVQTLWTGSEAASSVLIRGAVTEPSGIVGTGRVLAAMGRPDWNPPLAEWIADWAQADATRPWPPEKPLP